MDKEEKQRKIAEKAEKLEKLKAITFSDDFDDSDGDVYDDERSRKEAAEKKAAEEKAKAKDARYYADLREERRKKREREKKRKRVNRILNLLIVLFAGVFLFCAVDIIYIYSQYRASAKTAAEVRNIFHVNVTEQSSQSALEGSNVEISDISGTFNAMDMYSLDKVIEVNPDTVGWIIIDDTVIDYVVVQSDDNDYYLHRDFYGNYNRGGTLLMDYRNDVGGEWQNYIVYGHRMNDGSMFGCFGDFIDTDFVSTHPTFLFIMEDGLYEAEIFSVYRCTTRTNYAIPYFNSEGEVRQYISECKSRSDLPLDVKVDPTDQILTLSTCDYNLDVNLGRLVVHAKLTKVTEVSE